MLNFLYEFLPVVLFFIAFKYYGIYTATVVGIVVSALQLGLSTIWQRRLDKKQLITLLVFILFGGMTLYFHNPIFVKWKPSVVFWIFGTVLFLSHFVGKKPLMRRMLESVLDGKASLPDFIWSRLNIAWTVFFFILGTINIYVAYTFSTETWVNFKLYGILGLLFAFSFLQALYLSRYISEVK
ncbi:MAG: septation protein A [Gammaproteobacteria bacterium]